MRVCSRCNEEKPRAEFRAHRTTCKKCCQEEHNEQRIQSREQWKGFIDEVKGTQCVMCGYSKPYALGLHHIYPQDKKIHFSRFINDHRYNDENKAVLVEEMKQAIRVCANCHNEIHARDRDSVI